MYRRVPAWACSKFDRHGDGAVCSTCLKNFQHQGNQTQDWDMAPRVTFGRGWFGIGAVHWFDATDDTLFPSKDGKRLLAQAVCGGICEMTTAWAPRAERECVKCLRALRKVGRLARAEGRNDRRGQPRRE
jgi:hypothetical protein